jgi:hypothetical protein
MRRHRQTLLRIRPRREPASAVSSRSPGWPNSKGVLAVQVRAEHGRLVGLRVGGRTAMVLTGRSCLPLTLSTTGACARQRQNGPVSTQYGQKSR